MDSGVNRVRMLALAVLALLVTTMGYVTKLLASVNVMLTGGEIQRALRVHLAGTARTAVLSNRNQTIEQQQHMDQVTS